MGEAKSSNMARSQEKPRGRPFIATRQLEYFEMKTFIRRPPLSKDMAVFQSGKLIGAAFNRLVNNPFIKSWEASNTIAHLN